MHVLSRPVAYDEQKTCWTIQYFTERRHFINNYRYSLVFISPFVVQIICCLAISSIWLSQQDVAPVWHAVEKLIRRISAVIIAEQIISRAERNVFFVKLERQNYAALINGLRETVPNPMGSRPSIPCLLRTVRKIRRKLITYALRRGLVQPKTTVITWL